MGCLRHRQKRRLWVSGICLVVLLYLRGLYQQSRRLVSLAVVSRNAHEPLFFNDAILAPTTTSLLGSLSQQQRNDASQNVEKASNRCNCIHDTKETSTILVNVTNRWDRLRYVCGKPIYPNTTIEVNATLIRTKDITITQNCDCNKIHYRTKSSCVVMAHGNGEDLDIRSSTRVFAYDPMVAPPSIEDSDATRTRTILQEQTPQNRVTVRLGQEVDFPIPKRQYQFQTSCDIPCSVWGDLHGNSFATIEGTPFRFEAVSMEGSGYYAGLQVDPTAGIFQNKYYSTTSFQSHVPLTYYSLPTKSNNDTHDLRSYPPVEFDTGIKGASFLARNCGSINHREDLVRDLIEAAEASLPTNKTTNDSSFRIDSLSSCLHHAPHGFPSGTNPTSPKRDIISKYLFHLAFENQNTSDYITEKLWETLKAGTIPVYWGASNVRDHLPHPHSVIVVADFSIHKNDNDTAKRGRHNVDVAALVEYLMKVANNKTLYDSHHAWRNKAAIYGPNDDVKEDDETKTNQIFYQRFLDKYEFTKTDFKCRMCRFAYSLQHGWGFDHDAQKVQPLQLSSRDSEHKKMLEKTNKIGFNRSTCFEADTKRMVYPLREEWDQESSNTIGKQQHHKNDDYFCSQEDGVLYSRVVKTPSHKFLRTIWDHDGVTDMEIRRILQQPPPPTVPQSSVVLRFVTPFSTISTATLVVDSHVSYYAETLWRNPDWQRYATASNKRARKRILLAVETNHPNSVQQGKMTLLWIQNEQSRIVLMVDAPPRDVLPNLDFESGNNFTGNLRVPLPAPGTIELRWPRKTSTLRIRWIVEDLLQYKGNNSTTKTQLQNKESYFSSFVVDEFSHPLIVEPIY